MVKKVSLFLLLFSTYCYSNANTAAPEMNQIDLFEMERGRPIWSANNSKAIQKETLVWIQSIKGFHNGSLSELHFEKEAYVIRIPTGPIRVKNEIMDTMIRDVFLYLSNTREPLLLLFDVNWPKRYLVDFETDVRPFLKKLGIWGIVKNKKYFVPPREILLPKESQKK